MIRSLAFPSALALAIALAGCGNKPEATPTDAGPPAAGLSAEAASKVVAKVGDRTITLGEFAKTLERMDQFDRLRYQTKERRRELLNEMINVELLSNEAKKRGLDKDPEVDDQIRLILRDAMLSKTREGLPAPAQVPMDEVRAYYEANVEKFNEPERRRVAAIVMTDKAQAQKVLKEAQKAKTAEEWGALFFKHSTTAPKTKGPNNPAELAGDLGIVGPPDDAKGGNQNVPDPVRAEVFKLPAVGAVAPELVEVEGKQFIVRLNGMTAAHKRSLQEAERSIRVLILQERVAKKEKELEEELRKKFPVQIDDKALAAAKLPAGMDRWFAMDSKLWPSPDGSAAPAASAVPAASGTPAAGTAAPDGKP